jgi:hypothetical protein
MKRQTPATQNKEISKFIQSVGEKNYAQANKSLQKTIENKLINKISQYKDINIFKQ